MEKVVERFQEDVRAEVQCGGCGYEWKVNCLPSGLVAEMCIVCGSLTVHSKNPKPNR